MVEFCREHSIPHEICGKLVVAADEAELPRLRDLHVRGLANGLEGFAHAPDHRRCAKLSPTPEASLRYAFRRKEFSITGRVCEALVKCIHGRVVTDAKVRSLRQTGSVAWICQNRSGTLRS